MNYQWAVVGAGPAGIAAVGKLLDHKIAPSDIVWIDPAFAVGDFGALWRHVPSNTKVATFLKFLHACPSFSFADCPEDFEINHKNGEETCELADVVKPLQWISHQLKNKVKAVQDIAENLQLHDRLWQITLKKSEVFAKKVILAIGAEPKQLAFPTPHVVSLQDAMDKQKIHSQCGPDETIAVFGSSHSAVLVLRNLIERPVKKIINFYRSSLIYAVEMPEWILFDNEGLKGPTAEWAREHLDGVPPPNLMRIFSNEENIAEHLPQCDKVIYAVGFERRTLPSVVGLGQLNYVPQVGIIAPGLFGLGIAFPEVRFNPLGMLEHRVGLWKFMDYLHKVMPIWLRYPE